MMGQLSCGLLPLDVLGCSMPSAKANIIAMNDDKQIQPMINKRKGWAKRRFVTKHALQFM